MDIRVSKNESGKLRKLDSYLQKNKEKLVDVFFDLENPPDFFRIRKLLYSLINKYEGQSSIIFHHLPYCFLSDAQEHVINHQEKGKKEKQEQCRSCKFESFCAGYPRDYPYGKPEKVEDGLPQVCVEITHRCNLDCFFCFSQDQEEELEEDKVYAVIDQAAAMDIPRIRFTGGEPLLVDNLREYVSYAKSKGLRVWLNTNGTLTERFSRELIQKLDSVLIPVQQASNQKEKKITGKKSLLPKIRTIKKIRKIKPGMFLRTGTALNEENKDELEKIFELTQVRLQAETEAYRQIVEEEEKIDTKETKSFIQAAENHYQRYGKRYIMANAFPFCFCENKDTARLFSLGGYMDDGRDRIVVDPEGKVKPMYYSKEKVGDWKNLEKAWKSDVMKSIRNLDFLPKICEKCSYKTICMGGNRTMAKNVYDDFNALDPLLSKRY